MDGSRWLRSWSFANLPGSSVWLGRKFNDWRLPRLCEGLAAISVKISMSRLSRRSTIRNWTRCLDVGRHSYPVVAAVYSTRDVPAHVPVGSKADPAALWFDVSYYSQSRHDRCSRASGRGSVNLEGTPTAPRPQKKRGQGVSWQSHPQKLKCKSARTAIRADKSQESRCATLFESNRSMRACLWSSLILGGMHSNLELVLWRPRPTLGQV